MAQDDLARLRMVQAPAGMMAEFCDQVFVDE
jgi:hypothetical protein